ncbi:glycosyl hydrolase family 18 protein [Nocardioides sp. AX2bis]|uniref:glycosyl hydrolase family 18 protein n=1 Tax=Nocardioides sp. AX2bis TaxID=2653157 RepID=UPI0012F38426|nr:glycosyl hydrolase family 18 protein [Nocardioides sp. AX2bis]VXB47069.1 Spore germination protein YaaH [Nocardioides sp. AX2bis]
MLTRTRATAALLTLALAAAAAPALPGPAVADDGAVAASPLAVTGYVIQSARSAVVTRDADALTTVTVAGVEITRDGASVGTSTRDARRLLRTAQGSGLRAELILSNYSERLGGFDTRAADRLLRSAEHRDRVVDSLVDQVVDQGWDGVNVDLEALRTRDANGLVALLRALSARLPDDREVSIDVSARTSEKAYRDAGYRLAAIGEAVDVFQLMAYDMHGPTWSRPGPIGPLDWQRSAAEVVLGAVPAEKLDLGVAGYGYRWTGRLTGRSLTVAQARSVVARSGAEARYDDEAGEWTATLPGGDVLWWSDGASYERRRELAAELGLHGLALWRLGSADRLVG